jgi:hypothetical protein
MQKRHIFTSFIEDIIQEAESLLSNCLAESNLQVQNNQQMNHMSVYHSHTPYFFNRPILILSPHMPPAEFSEQNFVPISHLPVRANT